jgi:hypothetical protein
MGKSWENHGKIMGTCGKPLLLHGFYCDLNNKRVDMAISCGQNG